MNDSAAGSTVLTTLVGAARRAVGLHGDAVGNAAASVRRDDRARDDRERIAADIAAYPTGTTETIEITDSDANRTAPVTELPPDGGGNVAVANDVYPLLSGGWRATCECGLAISLDDEPAGWTWVIDHVCTATTA